MKKYLSAALGLLLLLSALALGGCGPSSKDALEGKWNVAAGEMMGVILGGDDIGGFSLDLKNGGKGTATVNGSTGDLTWKHEGDKVTLEISGETLTATAKDDAILTFDDFMGMGMKIYFVKEGASVDMSQFQTTTVAPVTDPGTAAEAPTTE